MLTTHIKNLRQSKGFTLIELLVVVTLIAILAVAVLAAINPIEQRRKAQDTGAINLAAELIGAEERFYAQYGCYTWNAGLTATSTTIDCQAESGNNNHGPVAVSTAALYLSALEDSGEVKAGFVARVESYAAGGTNGDYAMQISTDAAGELHVALVPLSDANEGLATLAADCESAAGEGAAAHYCVPDSQEE